MQQVSQFAISCPTEIRFGAGSIAEIASLLPDGTKDVVLVKGSRLAPCSPIIDCLQDLGMTLTLISCNSEPSVISINAALESIGKIRPHAVIAFGGGSAIDTGKALTFALCNAIQIPDAFDKIDPRLLAQTGDIPLIAIPTTAGTGAEVTANAVLDVPSKKGKFSLRGRALYPRYAIVDPDLTQGCRKDFTLRSGMDAITQVIEAYTSSAATPFSDALSLPAISTGLGAIQNVLAHDDPSSRNQMAWVSLSSGLALANSGLGAAHGLASVLGSKYNAPHGALCGQLLLPVLRKNLAEAVAGSLTHQRLALCHQMIAASFPPLEGLDGLSGLAAWLSAQGQSGVSKWGASPADFEDIAAQALHASSSKKNGVDLSITDFVDILVDAY